MSKYNLEGVKVKIYMMREVVIPTICDHCGGEGSCEIDDTFKIQECGH